MADTKLSALPAASALNGAELIYGSQGGASVQITTAQFKTFALGVIAATSIALGGATIGTDALAVTGTTTLNGALTANAQATNQGLTTTAPGWYAQITGDSTPRARFGLNVSDVPSLGFGSGSATRDTFLERAGVANFRFGTGDAAAPVAQTLSVQNVVTGTTNTAGADFTIAASQGTGTGVGGNIVFKGAAAGSTGSAVNALATLLTIAPTGHTSTVAITANSFIPTSSSAPSNGMYLSAANTLGFATNSTGRLTLDSGGNVLASSTSGWRLGSGAASATAPTLIPHRGSTTTGWGAQASGNISGVIAGAETFRFTATALQAVLGTAAPAGGTAGTGITLSSATNFGFFFGSGAPTLSAAQGSLYLRSDGSSTSTRLYVNTDGSTTWTNVTTAA